MHVGDSFAASAASLDSSACEPSLASASGLAKRLCSFGGGRSATSVATLQFAGRVSVFFHPALALIWLRCLFSTAQGPHTHYSAYCR